jgi:hypothetical protein
MDPEGDKQIKKSKKKRTQTSLDKGPVFNVGTIFQSIWIRCCTVFPNITNRGFMEGQFRTVLYCGILFWIIYLLYEIAK